MFMVFQQTRDKYKLSNIIKYLGVIIGETTEFWDTEEEIGGIIGEIVIGGFEIVESNARMRALQFWPVRAEILTTFTLFTEANWLI